MAKKTLPAELKHIYSQFKKLDKNDKFTILTLTGLLGAAVIANTTFDLAGTIMTGFGIAIIGNMAFKNIATSTVMEELFRAEQKDQIKEAKEPTTEITNSRQQEENKHRPKSSKSTRSTTPSSK